MGREEQSVRPCGRRDGRDPRGQDVEIFLRYRLLAERSEIRHYGIWPEQGRKPCRAAPTLLLSLRSGERQIRSRDIKCDSVSRHFDPHLHGCYGFCLLAEEQEERVKNE